MTEITVEKLATTVGTPSEKLLLQMKEAGLKQSSPSDLVTDKDKKTLLGFLKDQQSKTSKTIRLKKKSASEGSNKTTTIAIKRKTVKIQEVGTEVTDDSNRIDFNEKIYIVEGPFDSLFIPNCAALGGGDCDVLPTVVPNDKSVIVMDNEPRNRDTINRMRKYISMNYTICIYSCFFV